MLRSSFWHALFIAFALLFSGERAHAAEPRGAADVPWVGRYEGSEILTFEQVAFDEAFFLTRKPKSPERDPADFTRLEGKRSRITYQAPKGRSAFEVYKNYEQRLLASGFTSVFACQAEACGVSSNYLIRLAYGPELLGTFGFAAGFAKATRYGVFRKTANGVDQIAAVYVAEYASGDYGPRLALLASEAAALETNKIKVPSAAEIGQSLTANGRIALYGVYFDTGSAALKPESKPTLDQILALMKASPQLSLIVAGHTDNTGDYSANLRLSEQRAAAVVAALVKTGVAPARLTAFGAGQAAPTASNDNEAGRAKNRRVELVRR